jgi:hypothetical protein
MGGHAPVLITRPFVAPEQPVGAIVRAYFVCRAGFAGRGMLLARATKATFSVLPRPKT